MYVLLITTLISSLSYAFSTTYAHTTQLTQSDQHDVFLLKHPDITYQTWHLKANQATILPKQKMFLHKAKLFRNTDILQTNTLVINFTNQQASSHTKVTGCLYGNHISAPSLLLDYRNNHLSFPQGLSITHHLPENR